MDTPNLTSLAVTNPEIDEVLNIQSGDLISAQDVIGSDYANALATRMDIQQAIAREDPIYVCPLCGTPVYIVSLQKERKFFFRHTLEDGRCSARTRGDLSQDEINARKYNGAKESQAHIRMKEIVEESLRRDTNFTEIKVETTWKGQDRSAWRRPDVQAKYKGMPIIFEVQLSTTFLRVIAERREFYLNEGALLCWIFKSFDTDKARLTQEDIFYNNNRNLFLVNEETLVASKTSGKLTLDCHWAEPYVNEGSVQFKWDGRYTTFEELTLDLNHQRVFLYDFDTNKTNLDISVYSQSLRNDFESFWLNRLPYDKYDETAWKSLRSKFHILRIELPLNPDDDDGPRYLLSGLYSAREGRPIGMNYLKLIQVAHKLHDSHKKTLLPLGHALIHYGRMPQIQAEDKEGKWQRKVDIFKPSLSKDSPQHEKFAPDHQFDALVAMLFPELKSKIERKA